MDRYILLVDNARFMRLMCRDVLEKEGYRIAGEAGSRREALEKYKYSYPDVVILNIVMPGTSGVDVLKELKEISSDAKVIMCSAMTQAGIVIESFMEGALDFIAKPFTPEKLISAVDACFNENRVFDKSRLKKALKDIDNSMCILSQEDIDKIAKYALIEDDNSRFYDENELMGRIKKNIETQEAVYDAAKNSKDNEYT